MQFFLRILGFASVMAAALAWVPTPAARQLRSPVSLQTTARVPLTAMSAFGNKAKKEAAEAARVDAEQEALNAAMRKSTESDFAMMSVRCRVPQVSADCSALNHSLTRSPAQRAHPPYYSLPHAPSSGFRSAYRVSHRLPHLHRPVKWRKRRSDVVRTVCL